jgi:tetratricopeptide (TPR) repeat protein
MLLSDPALASHCPDDWEATLISVEGRVHVRAGNHSRWEAANPGRTLCRGDIVRVLDLSRAGIRLPDDSVMRVDQNSTLAFPEPENGYGTLINLMRGILHLFSRDPRALRIDTPYANAGLEGTEFVITAGDDRTDVTVLEGEVVLGNSAGELSVRGGESASVGNGTPPQVMAAADPLQAISWALYYVPVLVATQAVAAQDESEAPVQIAADTIWQAARMLAVGRTSEAEAMLLQFEESDLASEREWQARAHALHAVMALAGRDMATATSQAELAVIVSPSTSAGWIALSHVQQARFDREAALASALRALEADRTDAMAWARVGELQLASGDIDAGLNSAAQAIDLNPALGHAYTISGFGELMRLRYRQAAATFRHAITLDQAAPLPRLGLGLALLRQRRSAAARAQIELAVLLDPGSALLRSYVARAYHDEHRGVFTAAQIELAKRFDPLDPTPWLYDALRKQTENRPVEALLDLERADRLNDNVPVLRSRLLVYHDLGSRSGAFGRMHRELGFERLALLKGWAAIDDDPSEYAGHRLLADVYSALPRHQIARADELYQSQLLQPINVTPIPPQLAEANLFILDNAGPAELAFSGLTPLAPGRGMNLQGSAVTADYGTRGATFSLAGRFDQVSFSVGYFDFATDGFRPNNDLMQSVANAFVQFKPGARTSILAEFRSTDTTKGDTRLLFDFERYNPLLRQHEAVDSVRIGLRHRFNASNLLLASVVQESGEASATLSPVFSSVMQSDGYTVDLQHQLRRPAWHLISGLRHHTRDVSRITETATALPSGRDGGIVAERLNDRGDSSAYTYLSIFIAENLQTTIGLSADRTNTDFSEHHAINPRLGITWHPGPRTTVRAAAFRTLQGWVASKHNIVPRLEPTQVAGFNQRYFAANGEQTQRVGVAVDHRGSESWYTGIELSRRILSVPTLVLLPPNLTPRPVTRDVREDTGRAYVYWAPTAALAINAAYRHERMDGRGQLTVDNYLSLRTQRLPVSFNWFHRNGFRAGLKATRIHQQGLFPANPFSTDNPVQSGSDRFWVFDAGMGYRLPRRRGLLSLHVHNALDTKFRFQDLDPDNPHMIPLRLLAFRFTVAH